LPVYKKYAELLSPAITGAEDGLLLSLDGEKRLGLRCFMGNLLAQIMRKS
jgi:hypothetical protein